MKKIKVSELRARVSFQLKTEVTNVRGGIDVEWQDDFDTWAKIENISKSYGFNTSTGNQLSDSSTHRIYIRNSSSVNSNHRIKYNDDYYTVNNFTLLEQGKKRFIMLNTTWESSTR